jgi:hypothetical protein
MAKGGGSANKTFLYQMSKAVLNSEEILLDFMTEKMKSLGTAACSPYYLSFVIGGTSAEANLKTVKLASARYYDALPTTGDDTGHAFRDVDLEEKVLDRAQSLGLGAQFGGNRSAQVTDACKKFGGFYLGSPGGPAARLGRDFIKKVELVEYEELGMEAVFMMTVVDFPAFIIVDDEGNDFYSNLL